MLGDVLDDCSSAGVLDGAGNAVQLGEISVPILGDSLRMLVAVGFLVGVVMFVRFEVLFHGLGDALKGE